MLTVDYDELGLRDGDLVLDMGAGAGRHSFECFRRGARVVALDYDFGELGEVRKLFWAMKDAGEGPADGLGAALNGDALRLPFPDDTFDRVICSEVFEHIPDDTGAMAEIRRVLKPGGVLAATVPSWFPEKVCWALSAEYHAPWRPAATCASTPSSSSGTAWRAPACEPGASHRAHALHSPYWWLKCIVGPSNDVHPLVKAYHRLLVWDIAEAPALTRTTERLLNPVLGKSVVVYSTKPARPGDERRSSRAAARPESASHAKVTFAAPAESEPAGARG